MGAAHTIKWTKSIHDKKVRTVPFHDMALFTSAINLAYPPTSCYKLIYASKARVMNPGMPT